MRRSWWVSTTAGLRTAALRSTVLALTVPWFTFSTGISADDSRTQVMLEALSRLKGRDLEANPALKNAVLNVLKQVDGKPAAVEIIRDFQLKDQAQALLDFALKNPTDPAAAEALIRLGRILHEPRYEDTARATLARFAGVKSRSALTLAIGAACLPDIDYPFHDKAVTVTTCGRICRGLAPAK